MPSFGQWLIAKGITGAARTMALFGHDESTQLVASLDASRHQIKTMDKVHRYAQSKRVSHEQAAAEMGVSLPEEIFARFRLYDPVRGHEEWPV